jgi:hypothetical protein
LLAGTFTPQIRHFAAVCANVSSRAGTSIRAIWHFRAVVAFIAYTVLISVPLEAGITRIAYPVTIGVLLIQTAQSLGTAAVIAAFHKTLIGSLTLIRAGQVLRRTVIQT